MKRLSSLHAATLHAAIWAFVTSALISLAQPAFAQQAKPGIERMYVLYCGDIALNDASSFTPGASGPGHLTVTCYLIKHARGWVLFDTGVGDHIVNMPNGQKSQAAGLDRQEDRWKANSPSSASSRPISTMWRCRIRTETTSAISSCFRSRPWSCRRLSTSGNRRSDRRSQPEMKAITPDGDHDLFGDGSVVLIATHGHSPGHQNLLVRLPKTGAVMLTGDSVHTKANWDSGRVPQRNFNVPQSLEALERMRVVLKQAKAELWIGHEPSEVPLRKYAPAFYE